MVVAEFLLLMMTMMTLSDSLAATLRGQVSTSVWKGLVTFTYILWDGAAGTVFLWNVPNTAQQCTDFSIISITSVFLKLSLQFLEDTHKLCLVLYYGTNLSWCVKLKYLGCVFHNVLCY